MERRGMSHSAPYGHACMSCFKAKCRCIPRQNGDGCERCRRLKKHCTPSNSTRRRVNPNQKPHSEGWVTPFEDLVPLFQSGEAYEVDNQHRAPCGLPSPGGLTGLEALLSPFLDIPTNNLNARTPESADPSTASRLEIFRSHMLPHFPLIHLPAETTAQQLQHQRPFLFQAIACVTSPTSCEKRVRAAELKRVLFAMAFLQHQKGNETQQSQAGRTMDLLLGLLVYVAWGWDHLLSGRLMTLAMSLVGEVLPSKFTASDMHTLGLVVPEVDDTGGPMLAESLLERQRAVLACFVLSSAVSTYTGQVDALRWTPHIKHNLAALTASTDDPADGVLALQVHLQLLTSQALQLRTRNRHTNYHAAAEALLAQLHDLHPAVLQHQGSLPAHFYHAELTILETLHATPLQTISTTIPTTTPDATPPTVYTTPAPVYTTPPTVYTTPPTVYTTPATVYPPPHGTTTNTNTPQPYNILLALQASTSALLTLPDPSFRGIALPQWAQLTACLSALHRLEGDTRWDGASVRLVVDLPVLLGAVVERVEGVCGGGPGVGVGVGVGVGGEGGGGGSGGGSTSDGGGGEGEGLVGGGGGSDGWGTEGVAMAPQKGYCAGQGLWWDRFWAEGD
ncbi:uncharacterized protein B0H64DRAFT_422502 [Chaetomium fimeti]|uniref:Zn(2)-C6 fungal-type domain-containing protein n=1 Tax=Chaetomium fimeti TaxID=1854472 RepID=A0AAE0HLI5_9PEZI|nr:hypothetical protein B0H64DRAFT_422502 [Chaetomium fimeti]